MRHALRHHRLSLVLAVILSLVFLGAPIGVHPTAAATTVTVTAGCDAPQAVGAPFNTGDQVSVTAILHTSDTGDLSESEPLVLQETNGPFNQVVADYETQHTFTFTAAAENDRLTGCIQNADADADESADVTITISSTISPPSDSRIFGGSSYETSLAVDPTHSQHVVVGFNDLSSASANTCAWAETRDSGATWARGSLHLPVGFRQVGDPWVRFGPGGQLFYSCLGSKGTSEGFLRPLTETNGVFIAVSSTGNATDLGTPHTIATTQQLCIFNVLNGCPKGVVGPGTDHPAFTFLTKSGGSTRIVACWTEDFGNIATFVETAYSDNQGATWSPSLPVGVGGICSAGGGPNLVGVSWWNERTNNLEVRSSTDGVRWSRQLVLASAGSLVEDTAQKAAISTTDKVLSAPDAEVVSNGSGLRIFYQVRENNQSQVQVRDLDASGTLSNPVSLGQAGTETFLPGTGTCASVVGMYQGVPGANANFVYTVWSVDPQQGWVERFQSTQPSNGQSGSTTDLRYSLPRIGDYTAVDCSGTTVWAAWTDTRDGHPDIWGAKIPLP